MESPTQIGPYVPIRELGRGAHGIVHEARAPDGTRVALKVLREGVAASAQARFAREVEVCRTLQHPNVIRLIAHGTHAGRPYLAMEFFEGTTLEERLRRGPLRTEEARLIAVGVARALSAAHERGVLHRDVKPANVLVSPGRVALTDFGLAFALEAEERLTKTGQLVGTPLYMAPEQVSAGAEELGPATDLYGLGATLYEALAGQPPYSGSSLLEIVARISEGGAPPPHTLRAEVDALLSRVCMKCLALDPSERYASAHEVTQALFQDPTPAQPSKPTRRGPLLALLGLVALALGVALPLALRPFRTSSPSPTRVASHPPSLRPSPTPPAGPTYEEVEEVLWERFTRWDTDNRAALAALAAYRGKDRRLAALRYLATESDEQAKLALKALPTDSTEWALVKGNRQRWRGKKSLEQAALTFQRGLERDPASRWLHMGQILTCHRIARLSRDPKHHDRLARVVAAAKSRFPSDPKFEFRAALVLKSRGEDLTSMSRTERIRDLRAAIAKLEALLDSESIYQVPLELGYARFFADRLEGRTRFERAVADLQEAIRRSPDTAHIWFTLGVVQQGASPTESDRAYSRAVELAPTNTNYVLTWATGLARRKQYDRAREVLDQALERVPAKKRQGLQNLRSKLPPP